LSLHTRRMTSHARKTWKKANKKGRLVSRQPAFERNTPLILRRLR
jgi:hypothetical protein